MNEQSLSAYMDALNKISMLAQNITDWAENGGNRLPDKVTWGDVGKLNSILSSLLDVADAI